MDWLSILRDPIWQAVGAILTGIGILVTVVLVPSARHWAAGVLGRIEGLFRWKPLSTGIFRILAAVTVFVASSDLTSRVFGIDTTILSLCAFALLSATLIAEYHSRKSYSSAISGDMWLFVVFVTIYVVVGTLALGEGGRQGQLGRIVFSNEIQVVTFALLLFFILLMNDDALWRWIEWTKEENAKTAKSVETQIKETITEAQLATTSELPRWWQFVEKAKEQNQSVTDGDGRTFKFYEFLLDCGNEINHARRILIIKPPKDFFFPEHRTSIEHRKKFLQDLIAVAGTVFQGYEIDYAAEGWHYTYSS